MAEWGGGGGGGGGRQLPTKCGTAEYRESLVTNCVIV